MHLGPSSQSRANVVPQVIEGNRLPGSGNELYFVRPWSKKTHVTPEYIHKLWKPF